MESHTAKYGMPKFAMDDVEIVLDELCAGYTDAVECRMRTELFDHYQSAFDDAVGEGLGEEEAHKKVLQDLGWETTVMVGRVCRGMGKLPRRHIHAIVYGKDIHSRDGILLFSAFSIISFVLILISIEDKNWLNVSVFSLLFLACLGTTAHSVYKMKKPSKKPLPQRDDIERKFYKFFGFEFIAWLLILFASVFAYQWFPENRFLHQFLVLPPVFMIGAVVKYTWIKNKFSRAWNRTYPEDKIS